jgi:hypothetical protein
MTTYFSRYAFSIDPLIDEANRRMRRRRIRNALLALIGLGVAAVIAYSVFPSADRRIPGASGAPSSTHVSFAGTARVGGLEIALPARFYHHTISYAPSDCLRHCMVTLTNTRVRTFAWSASPDQEVTPLAKTRVILALQLAEGPGCAPRAPRPSCAPSTLRLPVTLRDLSLPRGALPMKYGTWHFTQRYKPAPGVGVYNIGLWVGRNASRADRAAALAALRSIRVASTTARHRG